MEVKEEMKCEQVIFSLENKMSKDVLIRAIDGEIRNLAETMNKCNTNDDFQKDVYGMANRQLKALQNTKKQIIGGEDQEVIFTTRKKVVVIIDLEDTAPEHENWLSDLIALEHTIVDRLEEPESVTVHSITIN
jgi:hypothetical protein